MSECDDSESDSDWKENSEPGNVFSSKKKKVKFLNANFLPAYSNQLISTGACSSVDSNKENYSRKSF